MDTDFDIWYKGWLDKNWKRWKDDVGVSKAEALANEQESDIKDIMFEAYRAGQHAEAIGMLEGLESLKILDPQFASPKGYRERADKEIYRISQKTHNFPHYTTCQTCEDGWDMQIDFLIKELRKNSNHIKE